MGSYSVTPLLQTLILCLLLFQSSVVAITTHPSDDFFDDSFDFYYFVQQWPKSFCNRRNERYPRIPSEFTIHGLWPTSNEYGKSPQFCDNSSIFDRSQIKGLEKEMKQYWPSLKQNQTDLQFWSYEWKKHGTCSNLTQHDYFNKTLSLRCSINLLSALNSSGITPDINREYSVKDIKEAINDTIGVPPRVICNRDERDVCQLFEIRLCVDKSDASTIKKCRIERPINCTDTVAFPPSSPYENTGSDEL